MRKLSFTGLVLLLAAASAHAQTTPFSIVALPDTQFYSASYPATFTAQTQWIVNNRSAENIVFVTHLGDVVDSAGTAAQWANANTAMSYLQAPGAPAVLPYSVCAGNHDMADGGVNFLSNYGPARYAVSGNSWYGGASADQLSTWQTFSADGFNFLHINLEVDSAASTPASALTWAQGIITSHLNMPTIISTHNSMGTAGRTPNGDAIWNGLVNANPQIFMVLNGHMHGEYQQLSTDASGSKVIEMLSDFQNDPNGGNGFLREVTFNPAAGQIQVKTYSPSLGQYQSDANSQFAFNVTFGADKSIKVNSLIAAATPPTALRGWWKMDDASGATAADSSPGWTPAWVSPAPGAVLNNGTLMGTAQLSATGGKTGGAVLLQNTSAGQAYVKLTGGATGNAAANLGMQQFTMAVWIKRTGAGVQGSSGSGGCTMAIPILCKGVGEADNSSNVDADFFLGINMDTSNGRVANTLCADFETYSPTAPGNPTGAGNGGTNFPVFGSGSHTIPVDNLWHHVAATWDGRYWKLYVDGQLDQTRDWLTSFTNPAPPVLPRYDSIQQAAIGAAVSSTGAASGGFYGYIDDVRLYDGALSGAEVAALAVPEPATLALLALGGLTLLRRQRGRRG